MADYRIEVFRGSAWESVGNFDERQLAMAETERMEASTRYGRIRVIEETFDDDSGEYTTRTIYRGGEDDKAASTDADLEEEEDDDLDSEAPSRPTNAISIWLAQLDEGTRLLAHVLAFMIVGLACLVGLDFAAKIYL